MARARAIQQYVCNECENTITKCSLCGKWFEKDEQIECEAHGLKHICQGCK